MEQRNCEHRQQWIDDLSLEEKARLTIGIDNWRIGGIDRLNLPPIHVADGPHGLRKQDGDDGGLESKIKTTCFPPAVTMASTWNRNLIKEIGTAIAEECLEEEVSVLLGPGVNIKRSALCGRNFEYFSEDPFLSGEMASRFIRGVESKGIGTSLKHFAVNNQEWYRMSIDVYVDERSLREIYLASFERAIKLASPSTVMCAYNKVNGEFASEHPYLLSDILRNEWDYQGLTMTDWGATNNRVDGLKAYLNVQMPGPSEDNVKSIIKAVKLGDIDESLLDDNIHKVLALMEKSYETFGKMTTSAEETSKKYTYNRSAHHELARKVSQEGTVLLKNMDNILPLSKEEEIIVIGAFGKTPRYQGSGSSLINPNSLITPIKGHFDPDKVIYARGYDVRYEEVNQILLEEAKELAMSQKKIILLVGLTDLFESEGFDRTTTQIPKSHMELISAVTKRSDNVIVVLANGSPINMPWLSQAKAVVEVYLSGQAGGEALWDIIYGDVNPSGKLAETFPIDYDNTPMKELFPMGPRRVEYREGLYVGYRYFDKVPESILFPFGYGLSYTEFEYSNLVLQPIEPNEHNIHPDRISPDMLRVTFDIKNIGRCFGQEVCQVYVIDEDSTYYRPEKELKGFDKIALHQGESKTVTIILDQRSFQYYDNKKKEFVLEAGKFIIAVGSSSQALHLKKAIEFDGHLYSVDEVKTICDDQKGYMFVDKETRFKKSHFDNLYGQTIEDIPLHKKGTFNENSTMEELRHVKAGRLLYKIMVKQMNKVMSPEDTKSKAMFESMLKEMPLRSISMMSGGKFDKKRMEGFLEVANGSLLKGLRHVFKGLDE